MQATGGLEMTVLLMISSAAGAISAIAAALALFCRPLRDKLIGAKDLRDGQRCLLRATMLHTYYKHREDCTIRQYEFENFIYCYHAYKALNGNSFADKIHDEVKAWKVVS